MIFTRKRGGVFAQTDGWYMKSSGIKKLLYFGLKHKDSRKEPDLSDLALNRYFLYAVLYTV